MSAEKEFGFIITQGISRNMTKAKLAEKFCNFLAEQKRELSKALRMSADRIHTNCYYDCDTREYKGMIRIKKECSDTRIEKIQNRSKAIWTAKDCEPYTISLYKNYFTVASCTELI